MVLAKYFRRGSSPAHLALDQRHFVFLVEPWTVLSPSPLFMLNPYRLGNLRIVRDILHVFVILERIDEFQ